MMAGGECHAKAKEGSTFHMVELFPPLPTRCPLCFIYIALSPSHFHISLCVSLSLFLRLPLFSHPKSTPPFLYLVIDYPTLFITTPSSPSVYVISIIAHHHHDQRSHHLLIHHSGLLKFFLFFFYPFTILDTIFFFLQRVRFFVAFSLRLG